MATENQNIAVHRYQKQFGELLGAVFGAKAYFGDFFAGGLEVLDGVAEAASAFSVKTSDIPVAAGGYDLGAGVGFGTGTGKSSRFGARREIVYQNTDVPYTWNWAWHEGIDRFSVNKDMTAAIADRLELHAREKIRWFNRHHADFIAAAAGESKTLSSYGADAVLGLFNALSRYFVDIGAEGERVAVVNAELYNAIMDHPLTSLEKRSGADIDAGLVVRFKGFWVREAPTTLLTVAGEGEQDAAAYAAFAYIENVGKAFCGINTVRSIESEDFDGVALQGAGKAGEFIPDDNRKAVVRVAAPSTGTP